MKKLLNISKQIKNNTYSYTGKGAFEAVVGNFKTDIIIWLEELVPLQLQIEYLYEKSELEFQKRNYTRILTKILPKEYKEFVSLNILVRDANIIAQHYNNEFNLTLLYDILKADKYLKYPGKYDKYVDFEIFQKFIMTYRDELLVSLDVNDSIVDDKQDEIDAEIEPKSAKAEPETNWTNLLLGR